MGSRDRRVFSAVVHAYFRLGRSIPAVDIEQRLLAARIIFPDPELAVLDEILQIPEELSHRDLLLDDRISICKEYCSGFDPDQIFGFQNLSVGIDLRSYGRSMWSLPRVFLRIRPGQGESVKEDLAKAGIAFETDPEYDHIFVTDHGKQVTETVSYRNGLFEIQDRSSQIAASMISVNDGQLVWDCCAGAGGKSLFIADAHPGIRIIASDKRASMIKNLNERIRRNRVQHIDTMVYDILRDDDRQKISVDDIGVVIADVPCSGSGTWARHPENLLLFDPAQTGRFASMQKKLMARLASLIKPGTRVHYITCSVFREENEDVVLHCTNELGYKCLETKLISGSEFGADTMFTASLVLDRHEVG
jgi:16S rRNA (cytosine967-C5)-methyltransferase